jgi:hypothetical protein
MFSTSQIAIFSWGKIGIVCSVYKPVSTPQKEKKYRLQTATLLRQQL